MITVEKFNLEIGNHRIWRKGHSMENHNGRVFSAKLSEQIQNRKIAPLGHLRRCQDQAVESSGFDHAQLIKICTAEGST